MKSGRGTDHAFRVAGRRQLGLAAVVLGGVLSGAGSVGAANYFESESGDLSDDYRAPTSLVLGAGANLLHGTMAGSSTDVDLFAFRVPAGHQLSAIRVLEFTGGGSGSFLGLQPGEILSSDPGLGADFPDPIGFALLTPQDAAVGRDVLETIVVGPPFFFERPLPAGNYAGWLNETGPASTYGLEFFVAPVPEPSTGALWCVMAMLWFLFRRR